MQKQIEAFQSEITLEIKYAICEFLGRRHQFPVPDRSVVKLRNVILAIFEIKKNNERALKRGFHFEIRKFQVQKRKNMKNSQIRYIHFKQVLIF